MTNFQKCKPIIRDNSQYLLSLKELTIRIPKENTKDKAYFSKLYASSKAGFDGEKKIDRLLETIPFPSLHTIIPNFQTQSTFGTYFQMDTLIVTNRYILLLEIKNIRGHIEFQENPAQIIRTYDGVEEKLDCPIHQIIRNTNALSNIVCKITTNLPVHAAVVFCNSSAHVSSYPKNAKILYKNQIDFYIENLNKSPEKVDRITFQKIVKRLNSLNNNYKQISLATRYSIDSMSLRQGIFCEICESNMYSLRNSSIFSCDSCNKTDKEIFTNSIIGLFGILGPELKRSQIQTHLSVRTRFGIIRALTKLNCTKSGSGKSTYYSLPK